MTKIQLATKAAWNGLMLIAFGWVLVHFRVFSSNTYSVPIWREVLLFVIRCLSLVFILRLWMSFRLPLRLTGTTEITVESGSRNFFIQTLRLGHVFVGLLLVFGSFDAIKRTLSLPMEFFPTIQSWITLWVNGEFAGAMEKAFLAVQWCVYPFGYILFTIYLLYGANRLVRRQIALLDEYVKKEPCNE
jgi:hypothetical protein